MLGLVHVRPFPSKSKFCIDTVKKILPQFDVWVPVDIVSLKNCIQWREFTDGKVIL